MNRVELSDRITNMWLKSRSDAGKSQEYVAKSLGVSKKTVQNWESGEASPNFRLALEWFECLGVPMYPYIMSLLYPEEIEGITAESNMEDLRKALHIYVDELDDLHVRELLYVLHGSHGSSPTGALDLITTYLHLPLAMKVVVTENMLSTYEIAEAVGFIQDDAHVLPEKGTLKKYLETAKTAVLNGKETYTLTEKGEEWEKNLNAN